MATIKTAIQLEDQFTAVLNQVISAVNTGVQAVTEFQKTMNSPVDAVAFDEAKQSIDAAAVAVDELNTAFQGLQPPTVNFEWQSDSNMMVFQNTGVERYQQEIQSTNTILQGLNQTQQQIALNANKTTIFSPQALTDINGLQGRLQGIQAKITQIENNPLNIGTDTANAELEALRGQLSQAVVYQNNLNEAVQNMDVSGANLAYVQLSSNIASTERYIRDNTDEQGRFNQTINQGADGANKLESAVKKIAAAYISVQGLQKALNLSDQVTSTTARLNLMNDGLQTTEELQQMIFASAERSRGSYTDTANIVSKLGMQAKKAFSSNEELIAFAEQLNKTFVIAGTDASGVQSTMYNLTQALASGVLRGQDLNAVMSNAQPILQNVADYMGVGVEKIRSMAAEGQLSADVIKNAMFAAADETNAKFEQMPQTFSQMMNSIKNNALMAFQPVLQRINQIGNSEAFQQFINGAIQAISTVANVALEIFNILVEIAGAVRDNWEIIAPIIMGAVGALVAYYTALGIYNAVQTISNGIKALAAFQEKVHAASLMMETGATFAATAAQYGFNAALLACPITWILLIVIAIIAAIYGIVAAINKVTGSTISATGIICGAFMTAFAFIGNILVAAWNLVVDVFVLIYNLVADVANFIGNVFTDPIGAICRLFFDLADTVLGVLQALANAIDSIFGSDLASSVQGWRDSLSGWVDDTFGKGEEIVAHMNADDMKLGRFDYSDAWDSGYSFGEGIENKLSNFNLADSMADMGLDLSGYNTGIEDTLGSIAGDTGDIKDSLNISEDELKYMRDIAEREAINRFTTAEIKIEQTNHNKISSKLDLDGVVSGLADAVNEAVWTIAEGVHA